MVVTWVKLYRDAKEVFALKTCDGFSVILLRDGMFTDAVIFVPSHIRLVQV